MSVGKGGKKAPEATLGSGWGVDFPSVPTPEEIKAIADAGCHWVRLTLPWDRIERANGKFVWAPYVDVVRKLHRNEIQTILVLDGGHPRHTGDVDRLPRKKSEVKAFCGLVEEALEVLGGRGVVWQLLSEPNMPRGDWPALKPEKYCRLVRAVAPLLIDRKSPESMVGPATRGFDWPFLEGCMGGNVLTAWDAVTVHPGEHALPMDWALLRVMVDKASGASGTVPLWADKISDHDAERTYLTNLSCGVAVTIAPRLLDLPILGTIDSSQAHYVGLMKTSREDQKSVVFRKSNTAHVLSWSSRPETACPGVSPFDHAVLRFRGGNGVITRSVTTSPLGVAFAGLSPMPAICGFDRRAELDQFVSKGGLPPAQAEGLMRKASDLGGELFNFDWRPSALPSFHREVLLMPRRRVSILPYVGQRGWGFAVENTHGQPLDLEIDYIHRGGTLTACGKIQSGQQTAAIPASPERPNLHDLVEVRLVEGVDPSDPSFPRSMKGFSYRVSFPTEFHLTSGKVEGQKHGTRLVWTEPSPALPGEPNVLEAEYTLRLGECLHLLPSPKDIAAKLEDVVGFGLFVCGDRSGTILRMQITDDNDQVFQLTHGPIDWEGWRYVRFEVDATDHWNGNGVIEWPIYYRAIAVVDAAQRKARGTLQFACPTVLVAP